jgi:hypothetical protein
VLPFVARIRLSRPAVPLRAGGGSGTSLPALAVPSPGCVGNSAHPSRSLRVSHHSAIVPSMRAGCRCSFVPCVRPNPSLNADAPHAWAHARRSPPPVSLFR